MKFEIYGLLTANSHFEYRRVADAQSMFDSLKFSFQAAENIHSQHQSPTVLYDVAAESYAAAMDVIGTAIVLKLEVSV